MNNKNFKILLVDDESDILEFLSYNIKKEGFEVYTASNGKEAIEIAKKITPHLILLDVMMPEMDGIETCEIMRQDKKLQNTIIAFLTARGEDYSQIAGFEAGGDDYIAKPVKPKVLMSRIKALLKRFNPTINQKSDDDLIIKQSNLVIDKEKYIVIKDGNELILPKKEFELLVLLISKPDRVFTRDEIFSSVWGDNIIVGDRTIDVHIRKLREKIGDNHIKTIKGVGYKFVD
ncbi:MAG: two-component system, OmpR family, alkaline phosphatase synthesis response regulator PhoP [Bacteroidales bacterium]|jgi:two-component system alkaline phosphatase synthesis response regulator PhoP|nr:two-component system, OmpR family, alkaline phosphatase synthesis response regulator PhoP [Bacteroidales bacterium]